MKKIYIIYIFSCLFVLLLTPFIVETVLAADPTRTTSRTRITSGTTSAGTTPTGTATSGSGSIPLPAAPTSLPTISMEVAIQKIFNIIVSVGELAFVIMLLAGGVMYITAGVNEQQAEKARKYMTNAFIGIIILFSAWGLATWVITLFKS